jgi:ABC-type branched-subunit amino acid transport system ATPase component
MKSKPFAAERIMQGFAGVNKLLLFDGICHRIEIFIDLMDRLSIVNQGEVCASGKEVSPIS